MMLIVESVNDTDLARLIIARIALKNLTAPLNLIVMEYPGNNGGLIMEINNVTLTEIRSVDYAQKYTFPFVDDLPGRYKPPCNVVWLMGWNRASNVKVGDKGKLVFKSGNRGSDEYSLFFFIKPDNQPVQRTQEADPLT